MVRIAEVVEEDRPLPAARCHMPRRYVGLGTAARGTVVIVGYDHACRSIATARDSIHYHRLRLPQHTIHHTHPSFVAMDTDMEPRDGKLTLRLHG